MTDIFGEMQGFAVRNDIYAHIAGIDIVRAGSRGGEVRGEGWSRRVDSMQQRIPRFARDDSGLGMTAGSV